MDVTKVPPHNLEAEASVLGALILDNGAFDKVAGFLSPDDFYRSANQKIFDEIRFLIKEGEPADLVTVCENLKFPNSNIEPTDYLARLVDFVPTTANIEYYAKIVKRDAIHRRIIDHFGNHVGNGNFDPEKLSELIEQEISDLQRSKRRDIHSYRIDRIARQAVRDIAAGKMDGLDSGFDFIRKTARKAIPSRFWVVGGFSSVGKSTFGVELVMRMTENANPKITIFSVEMAGWMYLVRMAANYLGMHQFDVMDSPGFMDEAIKHLQDRNVFIIDDLYDWADIQRVAREIKKNIGLDVMVVDFMQKVRVPGRTIYEQMRKLAQELQDFAKELECTVVAMSQVSIDSVNNKTEASGFKGAGEIEESADFAVLLVRDVYEEMGPGAKKLRKDHLTAYVRKNRHGPTGSTKLRYTNDWSRLEEADW